MLFDEIASGGMASVHFGQLCGPAGFSRVVAIKRLHANFAKDPEFVAMFLEEARLAARIRHLNVVSTLDVVADGGEVFLVMEYIHGQSLANLWRATRAQRTTIDPHVVASIMSGVCHGLHAAHEARGDRGEPLRVVHRDVSPQNILVGADGVARVLDFGVAKAVGRVQTTSQGRIKGKLAYMPPEQLQGVTVTRRADVYAAGVVLWELLTGKRAFARPNEGAVIAAILDEPLLPPSHVSPQAPPALDAIVMRALDHSPHRRHATAQEMALDIERTMRAAPLSEVGGWVLSAAREELERRAKRVAVIDGGGSASQSSIPRSRPSSDIPTKPSFPVDIVVEIDEPPVISRVAVLPSLARYLRPVRARMIARAAGVVAAAIAFAWIARGLGGTQRLEPDVPGDPAPLHAESAVVAWPALPPSGVPQAPPGPLERPAVPSALADDRPAPRAAPRTSPPPPRATAKPKRECDPPFTVDDHGHKHYKATCLE
jgi:serine/threonine-protein kinase